MCTEAFIHQRFLDFVLLLHHLNHKVNVLLFPHFRGQFTSGKKVKTGMTKIKILIKKSKSKLEDAK